MPRSEAPHPPVTRTQLMPALTDEPDAELVARCQRGEAAAWRALVQRYQRLVYAVGRRAGLDEHATADIFQTVFARLVEHLPRLREGRGRFCPPRRPHTRANTQPDQLARRRPWQAGSSR